jgi:hypothetical protein
VVTARRSADGTLGNGVPSDLVLRDSVVRIYAIDAVK